MARGETFGCDPSKCEPYLFPIPSLLEPGKNREACPPASAYRAGAQSIQNLMGPQAFQRVSNPMYGASVSPEVFPLA